MKYIDADKIKAEIERLRHEWPRTFTEGEKQHLHYYFYGLNKVLRFVESMQQEQPESSKSKFVFPKFLYARTTNNKTIDVSYAPQSLDAIEYVRKDVFIEKAATYIQQHRMRKPTMIEKFKKYMEEE